MGQLLIPILVGVTSVAAYFVGARRLGFSGGCILKAVRRMLECLGITVIFLGVNLGAAVIVVLAARALTREFVSLYLAADATLLVLSLIQALIFQAWQDLSGRGSLAHGAERPPRTR
jgi:type IV secretory pathway VirB3-like protein